MDDAAQISIVQKLVGLSQADWKYADLYLGEAEAALAPLCTREHFRGFQGRQKRVTQLTSDLRRAIRLGDWPTAEQLACEGSELRSRVAQTSGLVSLAEKVYGKRSLDASTTTLALSGAVAQPASFLKREIDRLSGDLRAVAGQAGTDRGFCERRAEEFDRLVVDLPADPPTRIDPSDLRDSALSAADSADFAAVLRIARSATHSGLDRLGRIRAPRPASGWIERLADPIPTLAIARATELGFEPAELEPNVAFNEYLSCCCADRAVLPSHPLLDERQKLEACTCGHACPPEIGNDLKRSLDAFLVHPYLTSAGTRYLPWFGRETLLVEVFPEEQPDAKTPLLEALSLPRRRGLARLDIEDALLSHGPQVCLNLGLDPTAYRIICIPFDVYKRLSDRMGWGAQRLWTHLDGYRVSRDLQLLGLVGGDIQFGGADDLCSVGRTYDPERITARFAVVRRDRFEAREHRDTE